MEALRRRNYPIEYKMVLKVEQEGMITHFFSFQERTV